MPRLVTVDGPSGSGKTTLGRGLATALALPLIDTGLFYRGLMVAAVRAGLAAQDEAALVELAQNTRVELETDPSAPEAGTRVDGEVAGEAIRDPRWAELLARLSGLPGVRQAVLLPQRRLAASGAVAVGRDCGTVVFPEAPVKLFLMAAEQIREERRRAQLGDLGTAVDAATLQREVGQRDRSDAARLVSPLRPAADAHLIDTGSTASAAVLEHALALCRAAGLVPVGG